MQKLLAILLLCVFGFWTAAPVLMAEESDSMLPACCRRGGQHHCSMKGMESGTGSRGPSLSNVADVCPYCPQAGVSRSYTAKVLPAPAGAFFAAVLHHPAVQAQTEALYRISFARTCQKRGPPPFLLHV